LYTPSVPRDALRFFNEIDFLLIKKIYSVLVLCFVDF
jgi:hypothetical protein